MSAGAMSESLCFSELRKYCAKKIESGVDFEQSGNFEKDIANMMRDKLKEMEETARSFSDRLKASNRNGEVIAQSILGMRHIEDARMKYGKVIQYTGDGVSKFDK